MLGNGWKDPGWTDVRTLRAGLDGDEKANRLVVFGKNSIEIEQKPIPQLLVDEVGSCEFKPRPHADHDQAIHPFYVFQVASLILWSLDNYYYYATCIFIISVFSIATTIYETKTVRSCCCHVGGTVAD